LTIEIGTNNAILVLSHCVRKFFYRLERAAFYANFPRCDNQGDSVEGGFLVDKKRGKNVKGCRKFQARNIR